MQGKLYHIFKHFDAELVKLHKHSFIRNHVTL